MGSNRLILDNKNCPQILKANTIVIKVGSSILVDPIKNTLKQDWLNSFLDEIAVLKKNNKKHSIFMFSFVFAYGGCFSQFLISDSDSTA